MLGKMMHDLVSSSSLPENPLNLYCKIAFNYSHEKNYSGI